MLSEGIVLNGERRAEIVTQEVETPAGAQVLVKTHAVGLCGSDVGLYHGTYAGPKNYPLYFGHEWSGTVEAVGPSTGTTLLRVNTSGDCCCQSESVSDSAQRPCGGATLAASDEGSSAEAPDPAPGLATVVGGTPREDSFRRLSLL